MPNLIEVQKSSYDLFLNSGDQPEPQDGEGTTEADSQPSSAQPDGEGQGAVDGNGDTIVCPSQRAMGGVGGDIVRGSCTSPRRFAAPSPQTGCLSIPAGAKLNANDPKSWPFVMSADQ